MAISLHNSNINSALSGVPSLTTTLTAAIGEIIVVVVANEVVSGSVATVSSISDGTANVYAKRFSASQKPEPLFAASEGFEVWWAYAANTLSSATITVTMSGAVDDAVLIVAGYQGFTGTAYQTAPWDTNASLPKTAQSTSGHSNPTATGISTTSTVGMLLAGACSCDTGGSAAAPTGWTSVQTALNSGGTNAQSGSLFDLAYSSAQSSITVTATGTQLLGWIFWVDALTSPASGAATIVEQSFFETTKLLRRPEFNAGPFAGTSPPFSGNYFTSAFFDVPKKKPVIIDKPDNVVPAVVPLTPIEISWFDTIILKKPVFDKQDQVTPSPIHAPLSAWFEPVKLKQPAIDNAPILFQPAAVAVTSVVEQSFFDTTKLKPAGDFTQGPFAGTSPTLTNVYITQAFFDQVKLKQPVIDRPSDMAPLVLVVNFSATNWFDAVKLVKVQERFGELYPQQYWTPESYDKWFDQLKLLKVQERLQESFGAPFPPRQSLSSWFDEVQKLKLAGDFPFTSTGATQPVTIQNALTDWFATIKLKKPIIDPGLVVYFPAQNIVVVQEHHDLPFFATPGSLMTR